MVIGSSDKLIISSRPTTNSRITAHQLTLETNFKCPNQPPSEIKLCSLLLLREGFKKPRHGNFPWRGGGVPPFSVNFFPLGFREPTVRGGGGGYPPFPLRKNPLKIGPKTVFLGEKTPFSAKKFPFSEADRPWRGGGVPPFSVNFFPLTFRKILVRGGPGGGRGTPPTESFRAWGF